MKCPQCQAENPEGLKFCGECGVSFERTCPNCNSINPPKFRFCGQCGHQLPFPANQPLQEPFWDEKLRKIQKYLPTGLVKKVLAQKGKIEGERKQVTVMFCDMKGFTPLVENLGPEESYGLLDKVLELLVHKVHDYEGTVNQMTGDGVMALFGAPIALEDAPQRAIRSAHAIHLEMARFSDNLKQEKGLWPIKMRIGINTGPVVIGTLGNDLRVEFTAVGDTVNLASRMEGLAEPGTTYVTEETFKLTEGLFRFEALGEKQVKGKEMPVKAYRVIAPSTRKTRFDISAERGLTPFVGRERGLGLLLDGFERVKEGRGQAFSIMGEAGVGKSRFLYEFRKAVANENVTFMEGKCLSYGRGMTYHPIIDIIKSNFDIQEEDTNSEIREKVRGGLKLLGVDESSALPYILELLSVKDSGIDKISMSPEARKERIMEALKQIVLKGSQIRPLVIAIEDLHWIDKSSEDILKYFWEIIPGARVLLVFTYRPEFIYTWGGQSYHNQITLNRLSNRESLFMVCHILGTPEIDKDLESLILEKTEGIPFFIEELLKSMKDLKMIERTNGKYQLSKDIHTVLIPSNIQDVIMARVDSLPDAAKTVLQTGSAIEREFPFDLIKRVTGLPEHQLLAHLSTLKRSELLYQRGIDPQISYIFRHALIREVLYDSILSRRRKEVHEKIAKAIEELYKDNLAEHYEVLAQHFFMGENYASAAEYFRLAGRRAEKAVSFPDATAYAKKRVTCLEKLPLTAEGQKNIIDARTVLALYLIQWNYYVEAKEAIDPIIELAVKQEYKRRLCQIRTILGVYYFLVEEDFPAASQAFEDALKISEEVKDIVTSVLASFWLGVALSYNCEFDRAIRHFQKALDITIWAKNLWGTAANKAIIAHHCYFYSGRIDLGFKTSAEAVRVAGESGDIFSKGIAYTSYGTSCYTRGLFEEAEKQLLKAVEFCERLVEKMWNMMANGCLGETYIEMGDFEKAKVYFEKAAMLLKENRAVPSWVGMMKVAAIRSAVLNKEMQVDLELLLEYSRNNRLRLTEGWISKHIGEILLNLNDDHKAEAEYWIQKAVKTDQRNGMRFHLGNDYALWAELFKRKGDRPKARETLGRAVEILKECGADGWVEKYEKELASIA